MRVFGQKKTAKFSVTSTTTAREFFSHHPDLLPFMNQQLRSVSRDRFVHPSVFPILALLARLSPSPGPGSSSGPDGGPSPTPVDSPSSAPVGGPISAPVGGHFYRDLYDLLLPFLNNPVYKIREMAAMAITVFCDLQDVLRLVESLANQRRESSSNAWNLVHGCLLLVEKMMENER